MSLCVTVASQNLCILARTHFSVVLLPFYLVIVAKRTDCCIMKSDEQFIFRIQMIYKFVLVISFYLLPFAHKTDINLKFIYHSMHFRCYFLAIAAKGIDQLDIWQSIIYKTKWRKLYFNIHCTTYLFLQNGCQFET